MKMEKIHEDDIKFWGYHDTLDILYDLAKVKCAKLKQNAKLILCSENNFIEIDEILFHMWLLYNEEERNGSCPGMDFKKRFVKKEDHYLIACNKTKYDFENINNLENFEKAVKAMGWEIENP